MLAYWVSLSSREFKVGLISFHFTIQIYPAYVYLYLPGWWLKEHFGSTARGCCEHWKRKIWASKMCWFVGFNQIIVGDVHQRGAFLWFYMSFQSQVWCLFWWKWCPKRWSWGALSDISNWLKTSLFMLAFSIVLRSYLFYDLL